MNANELIEKVRGFEDAIAELTEQVGEFKKQIESFKADEEKKFERVESGLNYFYVSLLRGKFVVFNTMDAYTQADNYRFNNNNYFLTEKRAQEVADKLNRLMRLERLHDELCPDVPILNPMDMKDGQAYYTIYFNSVYKCYSYFAIQKDYLGCAGYPVCVFFPKEKIAQQVCDILNKELEQTK